MEKEKIVTINGKKYVEKKWDFPCDESFKYIEELRARNKK